MSYTSNVAATDIGLASQYNNLRAEMCFAGICIYYCSAVIPDGWLLCNGQAVSRANYADLFNTINTVFGVGDGSTTFNVPDARGRFIIGVSIAKILGSTGGSNSITITEANMPSHLHSISADGAHSHDLDYGSTGADIVPIHGTYSVRGDLVSSTYSHFHGNYTGLTGSGTIITTKTAYQIFNLIIKV